MTETPNVQIAVYSDRIRYNAKKQKATASDFFLECASPVRNICLVEYSTLPLQQPTLKLILGKSYRNKQMCHRDAFLACRQSSDCEVID